MVSNNLDEVAEVVGDIGDIGDEGDDTVEAESTAAIPMTGSAGRRPPRSIVCRRQHCLEVIRGVPVTGWDPCPVDVQRGRCPGVPEPVRHGADVDPCGQQFGGDEVPEIVDPHVSAIDLRAEPLPTTRDQLRSPRLTRIPAVMEHEVRPIHRTAGGQFAVATSKDRDGPWGQ